MARDEFQFSDHAIDQMAERGILLSEVIETIEHGEIIEKYPDDVPLPSQLSSARLKAGPLHVVWATNVTTQKLVVITTNVPDADRWSACFRTRRQ